ncbi:SH3 and cysteine-rich domain-containing 3 [Labeo rohita]|uniref:SH3 and cysteine-rich domain-containing 3 n=1 Tax=Labeo rohita TaxID=84645 RepID=A0A498NYV7_LABRO|nr:SH3 and cysteine-rich domain-containing 3 [Labeo rohita]
MIGQQKPPSDTGHFLWMADVTRGGRGRADIRSAVSQFTPDLCQPQTPSGAQTEENRDRGDVDGPEAPSAYDQR